MVEDSSGSVKIKNLNTNKLDIKGSSGNVSLDYLEINGDINVSIKSGNLLFNLEDKDSNIHWLLQSGSGKLSVAIPLENCQQNNRKTQGQTGDGSFNVQLQTTSGNITIKYNILNGSSIYMRISISASTLIATLCFTISDHTVHRIILNAKRA